MQLNEILEENTIKSVSEKTNISEINIEALHAADFAHISRVKTMGFLSILEREYAADLSGLREQAKTYYDQHTEEESITLGLPISEPNKKGKSKIFMLLVMVFIGYALWYAYIHFDQKKFNASLPEPIQKIISSDAHEQINQSNIAKELSIENSNTEENAAREKNTTY